MLDEIVQTFDDGSRLIYDGVGNIIGAEAAKDSPPIPSPSAFDAFLRVGERGVARLLDSVFEPTAPALRTTTVAAPLSGASLGKMLPLLAVAGAVALLLLHRR